MSGWGYTSPSAGEIPSTLRTVTLPIVSAQACNSSASFNGNITENMICAGYSTGGKDACKVSPTECLDWLHRDREISMSHGICWEYGGIPDVPDSGCVSGGLRRPAGV